MTVSVSDISVYFKGRFNIFFTFGGVWMHVYDPVPSLYYSMSLIPAQRKMTCGRYYKGWSTCFSYRWSSKNLIHAM